MKKNQIKLNELKISSFQTSIKDIKGGGVARAIDSHQGHTHCDGCHISH
ncbi:MAG: hypothetical protein WBB45_10345 [Cyclobacteriaceae bacterium]